jgi:hypothetical protein
MCPCPTREIAATRRQKENMKRVLGYSENFALAVLEDDEFAFEFLACVEAYNVSGVDGVNFDEPLLLEGATQHDVKVVFLGKVDDVRRLCRTDSDRPLADAARGSER